MTAYSLEKFFANSTLNLHMGRTVRCTPSYYAMRLGSIPATYNTVVTPRPTIWYDAGDAYAICADPVTDIVRIIHKRQA